MAFETDLGTALVFFGLFVAMVYVATQRRGWVILGAILSARPELMLNVAISGSVQYQLGMQNSKCIAAVNHSADAPIFDIAHYGVVADYREFIPALIEELKLRRA